MTPLGWLGRKTSAQTNTNKSSSSVKPPFEAKFHFHGKFWINLGYHIYSRYSHPLLFTLYFSSTSPFYVMPVNVCKIAGWVANSVDWPRSTWPHWVDWAVKPQHADQMPHYAASDLHCLIRLLVQICSVSTVIWWNRIPLINHLESTLSFGMIHLCSLLWKTIDTSTYLHEYCGSHPSIFVSLSVTFCCH